MAFVEARGMLPRFAPMSSWSLRAKLLLMRRYSAVKKRRPSCARHQITCLVPRYLREEDYEIRVVC